MTGLPDYNYPTFNRWAETLRRNGYEVVNPAENHEGRTDLPLADYFKIDLPQVCEVDAVVVLPGWEKSKGASLEVALARHLGKPVYDGSFNRIESPAESILAEADRIVATDRQSDYGHPIDDFTRTGRMWGAILGIDDVPPEKVGLCMAALKISREVNKPKRDNRVDAAGYIKTVELIQEKLAA